MRLLRRSAEAISPPTLRRSFVTPEGVDLGIELGSATARATAFLLDWFILAVVLVLTLLLIGYAAPGGSKSELMMITLLIGLFLLRNGWFILFEMGRRGATPGKRILKLRVIARDGGRLTGAAVIARNALREIEIFLPLSFLVAQRADGPVDGYLVLFSLLWSGIFFLFPLFNRDRLRVGDVVAGTWVVSDVRASLGADLGAAGGRRVFSDAALNLYGEFELQTLETVLRLNREDGVATVAATIRRKAGLSDDGDDYGFLSDYYAALCGRLERGMMTGRRRASKHSAANAR